MNGEEFDNRQFGSLKAAKNSYGEISFEGNSPMMKPQMDSAEPSPRQRELHQARSDMGQIKESRRVADSVRSRVETELSDAKKTVRDLASKIEKANARAREVQRTRKPKWREESDLSPKNNEDNQYAEVMKQLEHIKEELSKLKVDMAYVLEAKRRAEKATEASSSAMWSYTSSVESIKKEIEELNEEQVLVELARIEALKEREAIEAQRKEEANRYRTQVEETKKKVNEMIQEGDRAKELEMTLAVTISDVNLLQSELALAKEMDRRVERTGSLKRLEASSRRDEEYSPSLLKSVTEELEAAKIELASIKEEGFNFMASMDVIREELRHVQKENAQRERAVEKRDLSVQHLNARILRATSKLEAISAAEEKANLIASNMSQTLEQLRTEAEAAKKERELIGEETAKIKAEIPKTESEIELAEERLEAAIQELEAVKSSEGMALENLKNLIEDTIRARESASQHTSTITISAFEYEYLTGRAGGAEEIADKKVAAAQAWVEALKANEKEILMKIEMAQREIREQRVEDEEGEDVYRAQRPLSARKVVEGEELRKRRQRTKNVDSENLPLQIVSPQKTVYRNGNMTPVKSARSRKLGSPGARHISVKRRGGKKMPNLAKFFSNKSLETER